MLRQKLFHTCGACSNNANCLSDYPIDSLMKWLSKRVAIKGLWHSLKGSLLQVSQMQRFMFGNPIAQLDAHHIPLQLLNC